MKLRILECDHVPMELSHIAGQYGDMFVASFQRVRPDWQFEIFKTHLGDLPDLDPRHGYLITGSKHDAFDDLDWIAGLRDWVRRAYAARLGVIGICFGHQLIAHALGGRAGRAPGWGVGRMPAQAVVDLPFASADMLVSHQDQVLELPADATRLLTSDFCPNYGFQIGRMIGIQGHPEFNPDYARALAEVRRERIGSARVDQALATLELPLNSDQVVDWLAEQIDTHLPPN